MRGGGGEMKALTLLQPWASLIACGAKTIETRSWATSHRGEIAIHAALADAKADPRFMDICESVFFYSRYGLHMPKGKVIAIATLTDCIVMTKDMIDKLSESVRGQNELFFGIWDVGRYAWMLSNVRMIEPVPARGMQRLWEWGGGDGSN